MVASFTMNNNSDQFNDDDSLNRNEYAPLAEHSSVDSESALTIFHKNLRKFAEIIKKFCCKISENLSEKNVYSKSLRWSAVMRLFVLGFRGPGTTNSGGLLGFRGPAGNEKGTKSACENSFQRNEMNCTKMYELH